MAVQRENGDEAQLGDVITAIDISYSQEGRATTRLTAQTDLLCPDCGGRLEDHNAVNRVPDGLIAHGDGACWKSLNTPFTERLRQLLKEGE